MIADSGALRMDRTRLQIRRILLLVDTLAPYRYWHKTDEIVRMVCERLGERVSKRTIERDLRLLESLGMAEAETALGERNWCLQWRVVLGSSEQLQRAAMRLHG